VGFSCTMRCSLFSWSPQTTSVPRIDRPLPMGLWFGSLLQVARRPSQTALTVETPDLIQPSQFPRSRPAVSTHRSCHPLEWWGLRFPFGGITFPSPMGCTDHRARVQEEAPSRYREGGASSASGGKCSPRLWHHLASRSTCPDFCSSLRTPRSE
jgi:hypothetical protein